jgi:hypothetical protein
MRKLLILCAIWLLPLAAHAQQSAGAASRLRPSVFSVAGFNAGRYCVGCTGAGGRASVAPWDAPARAGAFSTACSQRGGSVIDWRFSGASRATSTLATGGRLGFGLPAFGADEPFRFLQTSEGARAGLTAAGLTADRLFGGAGEALLAATTPSLRLFGAAAYGCAAEPLQSGGGTVNSGTAGNFAFYASTGATVSESTRLSEVSGNTLTYSGTNGLNLTGSSASGQLQLSGASSGAVTLSVKDSAGTYTFKLPDSAGASGQVLTTDGTGTTSWTTPAGGGGSLAFDTLSSGSVVTWTFSGAERRKAKLTLGANASLVLSGVASGAEGDLYVKQDGTGSRTLALPTNSYVSGGGTGAITLSSAPNALDKLHFAYDGANYYWDAPVANYTSAVTSKAIIFNGTSQGGMVTLPNTSPFTSVGGFQILFRVRSSDGSGGPLMKIGGVFELADIGSGIYNFGDVRDGVSSYHTTGVPAGSDRVFRLQYDPSNSRWTIESWSPDGTNYVSSTRSITTTTNFNMGGQALTIGTNSWGMAFAGAHFDWVRFIARVQTPANSCPTPAPPTGVTWLADYEFDSNGDDSQGAAGNLTLIGSPTYETSPAQTCP